uniref:ATP synthase F0 subunit 8 n=1 Tax=Neomaskellia andropogonis TaxID=266944 RepID=Q697G4_NEOAD|nr:ATP synthase F0 subunit 8 [Neomaskellia andropogonis]
MSNLFWLSLYFMFWFFFVNFVIWVYFMMNLSEIFNLYCYKFWFMLIKF